MGLENNGEFMLLHSRAEKRYCAGTGQQCHGYRLTSGFRQGSSDFHKRISTLFTCCTPSWARPWACMQIEMYEEGRLEKGPSYGWLFTMGGVPEALLQPHHFLVNFTAVAFDEPVVILDFRGLARDQSQL